MAKGAFLFLAVYFSISIEPTPTEFSKESLADIFVGMDAQTITLASILKKHHGKTVFIDIWASWCRDCIVGMPKVNELRETYPNVQFVFLSVDHEKTKWKKGIKKFRIEDGEHYLIQKGWKKSPFCDFIDLDWIPRYMVIDGSGEIKLFKAIKATDTSITKQLDALEQ